jgi:hypothetical protein
MSTNGQITLPPSCGSIQDLTNPDFCGVGVLGSYTVGVALVFLHQAGFAILGCTSRRRKTLPDDPDDPAPETARFQFHPSISASSISLFDTAIVLSISWQIAALLSLNSPSSVQTSHDVLLVCLTTYASLAISFGALCTSFDHVRRHKYRLLFALLATILCAAVTGMGQRAIQRDNFPKETCLPFFTDYKPAIRRYFVVLSVVFWAISLLLLGILYLSLRRTRLSPLLSASRLYIVLLCELTLLTLIVLVNHHFVPEQVLRAQAGGQLAESQWTFGQIVGMLIWVPVLVEFGYIFLFGPKEGLEGRLPVDYYVTTQRSGRAGVGVPLARSGAMVGVGVGVQNGYRVI